MTAFAFLFVDGSTPVTWGDIGPLILLGVALWILSAPWRHESRRG